MNSRIPIAALIAAAALAPAAAGTAGQDLSEEVFYDRDFDVRAGGLLRVEVGDMDIRVESGPAGEARVRVIAAARDLGWARERFEAMRFSAGAGAGGLEVRTRPIDQDWETWRDRGPLRLRAEITVPARSDLEVTTGDGDVEVGSFEGAHRIRTGDGDIAIAELSGPRIEIHTGDGDVRARRLDAGTVRVQTGDGDLALQEVAGTCSVQTGDGDVSLGVARFEGLSIRTGDGDVVVALDPGVGADLDLAGEDLEIDRPFRVAGTLREHRVEGTLNGGGPALLVRTGDGSIRIRAR